MRSPRVGHALISGIAMSSYVCQLNKICMDFAKQSGEKLSVLSDINLTMKRGEIVGLLGRSGCGKSTLLRIVGGLIRPSSGNVAYQGHALNGPPEGISIVFQTFALYPWLTVQENVELGLDAIELPRAEKLRRTRSAIDLIGLNGFQLAYPRELSGGMRQRVGFARAIVSNPTLLLMDEPFSALDVLTAETLRMDFLDLWCSHQLPTQAVLMVTHNIEEAILMCDRIIVIGGIPGHIVADIPVQLSRPRNREDEQFRSLVDRIYSILISRLRHGSNNYTGYAPHLPIAAINRIAGLLSLIVSSPYNGTAELASLAGPLSLDINDILPIAAAAHMLEFAELKEASIKITAAGRLFAQSPTKERKRLFAEHLLAFVPLIAHICKVLEDRSGHNAPRERFELELQDHLNSFDAERTLRTAIAWGRYGELFSYDDNKRIFSLRHRRERARPVA